MFGVPVAMLTGKPMPYLLSIYKVKLRSVVFAERTMREMLTEEDIQGLLERAEALKMQELFEEPSAFEDEEE